MEKPADQSDLSTANGERTSGGTGSGFKHRLANRFKRRPDDHDKKKQLQDYTSWVNNFLRKRPGTPLVSDLRVNLQDGVSFVHLVEIVAKVELDRVERWPKSPEGRRGNIESAVEFLRSDEVILHPDAVKDILEGNAKGIMRVILAMAERYLPHTVKARANSDSRPPPPASYVPDQRTATQPMSRSSPPPDGYYPIRRSPDGYHMPPHGRSPERPPMRRSGSPDRLYPPGPRDPAFLGVSPLAAASFSVPNISSVQRERSNSQPTPPYGYHGQPLPPQMVYGTALSQPERPFGVPDAIPEDRQYSLSQQQSYNPDTDMYSNPIDQLPPWQRPKVISSRVQKRGGGMVMVRKGPSRSGSQYRGIQPIPEEMGVADGEEIAVQRDIGAVISGLTEFKSELLQLHALLLRNSDGSDSSSNDRQAPEGASAGNETPRRPNSTHPIHQLSRNTAALDKSREISELQDQLSQVQDEFTQKEAECATLRNMVEERNTFITTMKTEIYRKEYRNDTERVELHNQILQKDAIIAKLEDELRSCQGSLDDHRAEVDELRQMQEQWQEREPAIQLEMEDLQARLSRLSSTEDSLQSKLSSRDKKIAHLEEKLSELQDSRSRRMEVISESMEGVREGLSILRASASPHDSTQQTIDFLERSISDLMAKLMERVPSPTGRKGRTKHREPDDGHHRDKDRERRTRRHKYLDSKPQAEATPIPPLSPTDATKVFYYMLSEKNETPYVVLVPKKAQDVTLRDFKSVFDRHGHFRFYFKTQDPDCGVVKEEIMYDDKVLPTWNGKILVWVSERGHHR